MDRPCYGELVAVILAGFLHVLTEVAFSDLIARSYNGAISVAFAVYVVWRIRTTAGVLRIWGMRRDNFWPALRAQSGFVLVGVVVLIVFGVFYDSPSLRGTFWMTAALYPVWGVAQQFALQNLIARNLKGVFSSSFVIALVASVLFGISHYPRLELVILTLIAGVCFTLVYRRFPNLWAVGIAHGTLGSLAIYMVLGEDPGKTILEFLVSLTQK